MFGKGPFGKGLEFSTTIVNGVCPACSTSSIFISLEAALYRCTTCGHDLEQKINGQISYIPVAQAGSKITLESNGTQKI